MRMLLSDPEAAAHVASLTTINTPHRGCKFADYLFKKVPKSGQERLAQTYNAAAELLGDVEPDFIAAVSDLTASRCREMFDELPPPEGVYCRSVGSVQKRQARADFRSILHIPLSAISTGRMTGLSVWIRLNGARA